MKRVFENYGMLMVIAGGIIALDQWTKSIVRANLPFSASWLPESLDWLSPYARIVHWHNTGAAFGMFQNGSMIFAALAFVVIGAIVYYFPQVEKHDWTLRLAMSMQLGGASGNLIDRLLHEGRVTDFISVGSFAVFNVADASISVGTVILLLGIYLQERAAKKEQASLGDSNHPSEAISK
ncbi:MAG: signal peptidase II [Anaerolineae bacterium]|nr:Lipoprotein signal peptidase [Anaerolineales bacterium]RIK29287.1 MAG: signal peptidase II [Anaerolineae bacterium]WKZ42827.1 MAG: signal peptidase II [Anaerolineales bacterium]WKZ49149.1 MAG: signal peptidase II [Anaerolineales bacterium]